MLGKNDSICFVCKNTRIDRCTWFNPDNPMPVKGWKAKAQQLRTYRGTMTGYIVHKCPNFKKEDWYKWEV